MSLQTPQSIQFTSFLLQDFGGKDPRHNFIAAYKLLAWLENFESIKYIQKEFPTGCCERSTVLEVRSSHTRFPQNIRHIKHCSEHPLITVLKLAGSFHKIAKSSSEPLKILISLIDSLRTSVASQSIGQSPEVTLYLYQLWCHIYTSNDVTAIAQSIGTQVWQVVCIFV